MSDTSDAGSSVCIADRFEVLGSFSDSAYRTSMFPVLFLTNDTDVLYARDRRKCCDHDFQSIVIIKCIDVALKEEGLVSEAEVYDALGGRTGFATLKWIGTWGNLYCIAMDYKGCNLERLQNKFPELFDPETVAMFAVQMVSSTPPSRRERSNPLLVRLIALSTCILSDTSMATSNRTTSR